MRIVMPEIDSIVRDVELDVDILENNKNRTILQRAYNNFGSAVTDEFKECILQIILNHNAD
jgi:hypothetical protein